MEFFLVQKYSLKTISPTQNQPHCTKRAFDCTNTSPILQVILAFAFLFASWQAHDFKHKNSQKTPSPNHTASGLYNLYISYK